MNESDLVVSCVYDVYYHWDYFHNERQNIPNGRPKKKIPQVHIRSRKQHLTDYLLPPHSGSSRYDKTMVLLLKIIVETL